MATRRVLRRRKISRNTQSARNFEDSSARCTQRPLARWDCDSIQPARLRPYSQLPCGDLNNYQCVFLERKTMTSRRTGGLAALVFVGAAFAQTGTTPPVLLHKIEPEYSPEARAAKIEGSVLLAIIVSNEGKATAIQLVRKLGHGLDEEAVRAVRQWRFKPA